MTGPVARAPDAAAHAVVTDRRRVGRLWIASELYYPEETSTGHVLTELAEALSEFYPVSVLCGQPTYSRRGTRAPVREVRHGVAITRCAGLTLNKDVLAFRLANMATLALSTLWQALRALRRDDVVIVVTNPPALPFVIGFASRIRRARCVLLIHDVYPEALIAAGLVSRRHPLARLIAVMTRRLYRGVSHICVIGRDMRSLVRSKMGPGTPDRITVIPNWAKEALLASTNRGANPLLAELGLEQKFVVQYAGNLGQVHDIELLFETARQIEPLDATMHFLIIGSGAKKGWIDQHVRDAGLTNVTILPARPRSDEDVFLRACDVAVMALVPGMSGVGVPSRLYNILAVGKPVIAAVDEASELAAVIREEGVGTVVPPGLVDAMVTALLAARADPAWVADTGRRAAAVARTKYALGHAVAAYRSMIDRLWDVGPV